MINTMTKKYILGAIVAIVVFGAVGWVKSGGFQGNISIENFYGNIVGNDPEPTEEPEPSLGIVEFPDGIPYTQLASNVLKEKVVFVSVSQIASLSHDPVELLPDPGNGFVYDIQAIVGFRKFASESWVFRTNATDDTGFEVKWEDEVAAPASGLAGSFALGASFSKGFVDGGAVNNTTSPSFQIWVPSARVSAGGASNGTASQSFEPVRLASSSAVYLTASATFSDPTFVNRALGEIGTTFYFRIIYRLINLNF